ncbi:MAG: hypothetical protein NVSMB3_06070 [Acidobacteriaceae bacterium]
MGCGTYVHEFRKLYEFHSLRSGAPEDFLQLDPKLASSEGFRLDFSDLIRTIRDRERGRLSAAEMLTIVGLAIGGAEVERAEADLRGHAGTVQVLLAGVGGWREAGQSGGWERRPAGGDGPGAEGPVARAGEAAAEGDASRRPASGIAGGSGQAWAHAWGGVTHGDAGQGPAGGEVSPEMKETLARLELASMQLKVYLDDIDRRMGRIEPHLEDLTAMVQTSERFGRVAGREPGEADEGVEEARAGEPTPSRQVPPVLRRRSEEAIAAAMEMSSAEGSAWRRSSGGAEAVDTEAQPLMELPKEEAGGLETKTEPKERQGGAALAEAEGRAEAVTEGTGQVAIAAAEPLADAGTHLAEAADGETHVGSIEGAGAPVGEGGGAEVLAARAAGAAEEPVRESSAEAKETSSEEARERKVIWFEASRKRRPKGRRGVPPVVARESESEALPERVEAAEAPPERSLEAGGAMVAGVAAGEGRVESTREVAKEQRLVEERAPDEVQRGAYPNGRFGVGREDGAEAGKRLWMDDPLPRLPRSRADQCCRWR